MNLYAVFYPNKTGFRVSLNMVKYAMTCMANQRTEGKSGQISFCFNKVHILLWPSAHFSETKRKGA